MGNEDAPASDEIPLKNGIYRGDTTEIDDPNGGETKVAPTLTFLCALVFYVLDVILPLLPLAFQGPARKRQHRILRHAPPGRKCQKLHRRLEVREEVRLRQNVLVVG